MRISRRFLDHESEIPSINLRAHDGGGPLCWVIRDERHGQDLGLELPNRRDDRLANHGVEFVSRLAGRQKLRLESA